MYFMIGSVLGTLCSLGIVILLIIRWKSISSRVDRASKTVSRKYNGKPSNILFYDWMVIRGLVFKNPNHHSTTIYLPHIVIDDTTRILIASKYILFFILALIIFKFLMCIFWPLLLIGLLAVFGMKKGIT